MRDIKFRLHDKDGITIGYEFHKKNSHGCYQIYQKSIRGDWDSEEKNVREGYFIAATHKCEFTGLKDKNGKEIYEGDGVKYEGAIGYVFYETELGMFMVRFKLISSIYSFDSMDSMYEVHGNIHDNPELLNS